MRSCCFSNDWKIGNIDTFYSTETGWYRKTFYLPEENRGKNTAIRFDSVQTEEGIERERIVCVNRI